MFFYNSNESVIIKNYKKKCLFKTENLNIWWENNWKVELLKIQKQTI